MKVLDIFLNLRNNPFRMKITCFCHDREVRRPQTNGNLWFFDDFDAQSLSAKMPEPGSHSQQPTARIPEPGSHSQESTARIASISEYLWNEKSAASM